MHHEEEYNGHLIAVSTFRLGQGFVWAYQIDGGPMRNGPDRPRRNEQLVLQEGIEEARWVVDRMATT